MTQATQSQIANLLNQAGGAHHTYEQTTLKGVYDEEWPTWYADYVIQHGINDLLAEPMTVEALGQALSAATDAHAQSAKSLSWADFTAAKLAG